LHAQVSVLPASAACSADSYNWWPVAGRQAVQLRQQLLGRQPTLAESVEAACLADAANVLGTTSLPVNTPPVGGPTPMELGAVTLQMGGALEALSARLAALEAPQQRQRPSDPRQHPDWPRGVRRSRADIERCRQERRCFICDSSDHMFLSCPNVEKSRYEQAGEGSKFSPIRQRSPSRKFSRSPNGRGPR
jgi:hypothetical protein